MQKKLATALLKRGPKFGLLLDEDTVLSIICCLVVYLPFQLPAVDNPVNVSLFLTELASQTAEAIYFFSECLVPVTCDVAAVMLDC
jgi:hypothetical protein